jgi:hypothetical protein
VSPEEREQRIRFKYDFPAFSAENLKVRAKTGKLAPFRLNTAQLHIHSRLESQRQETGKVRALILKARQQGVSSYIGGRFYHRATHWRGTQVFILTHEQDATDNLFGMVERFHKYNHPAWRPSTGAANAKELSFASIDSGYSVGTAGSRAVGRSKTVQLFHGSEVAFWPNASEHFAGVGQTVPDLPDTEMILESTANGIGGEFHERWQMAERGEGDFIPIFVPWFWSEEYRRPKPDDWVETDDEQEYRQTFGLPVEAMVWRRAKLAELKDPLLFRQEYPATAVEAFQATGHDSFIGGDLVLSARRRQCEALGSLVIGVDPARFGDDSFAIAWRRGRKVERVERKSKLDTVEGANWVKSVIDRDKPLKVFIDVGGQGAGVVDILKDYGEPYSKVCEAVNFGGTPQDLPKTNDRGELVPGPRNRRAEMWMRSRDWLDDEGGADIPDDDSLHADAVAPGYKYDMRQYLLLESKEDIRKRGLKSPDGWDAVALTFASPVKALEPRAEGGRWRGPWRGRRTGREAASAWGR